MLAIFDLVTGALLEVAHGPDGIDMEGKGSTTAPDPWFNNPLLDDLEWDATDRAFVAVSLAPLKAAAMERIDMAAGAVRAAIASRGYGQEMTYVIKADRARACLADPAPTPESYPMLAAEIGITGPDLIGVATAIVALADQWELAAGAIEAVRLSAKQQVAAATSRSDIETIEAGIVWPVFSL